MSEIVQVSGILLLDEQDNSPLALAADPRGRSRKKGKGGGGGGGGGAVLRLIYRTGCP